MLIWNPENIVCFEREAYKYIGKNIFPSLSQSQKEQLECQKNRKTSNFWRDGIQNLT